MLGFDLAERPLERGDLRAQRAPACGRGLAGFLPAGSCRGRAAPSWVMVTYSAAATSRGSTPVASASRAASAAIVPTAEGRGGVEATNVPLPCWLSIRPSCSRRW